ncbi:MAG: conjugal transfer protein TraF [Agitococcus sp.]|nr:conjugal transfer protein TraF [Agitococcus sp.]MDO9176989.1 conjugal transfer protein TraF [Agitococcus sp.]
MFPKLHPALGLCLALLIAFPPIALAASAPIVTQAATQKVEKGWFFFEDPPVQKEPSPPVERPPVPTEMPPAPKENKCTKKETWTAACGFVQPGGDFEFQSKQRDALMENMAVAPNDPKAVEAVQYYMRWTLERTSEVTNLWWYNMVQNPELDPTSASPVSAFGLRLMTDVQKGKEQEVFGLIKEEGGTLVVFTRSDCVFCHQMVGPLQQLAQRTKLPIRNASLDSKCEPAFQLGCMTAPESLPPAAALQIATVPSVFLYVKPNTWLRVATGVVDTESMATRTMQFFSAYRNALLKGVENGQNGRASVDFSSEAPTGNAKGLVAAKESGALRVPTDTEISKLVGQSK